MFTRLLFYFIQWTWGIPQNIAGVLLYLSEPDSNRFGSYEGAFVVRWNNPRCLSMGMYIFLSRDAGDRMLKHEYGHCVQSEILGPLYLILVGIPSLIWCSCKPVAKKWQSGDKSYFSVYPEKWADSLGHVTAEDIKKAAVMAEMKKQMSSGKI